MTDESNIVGLAFVARKSLEAAEDAANQLEAAIEKRRAEITATLDELVEEARAGNVFLDTPDFEAFLKEPYCIVAAGEGEWRVVVPRFVDFHVGMLDHATSSYNVFRVNKFAKWLGNVPKQLMEKFQFKDPLAAVVEGGVVHVPGKKEQDEAWDRYKDFLTMRQGETRLRIKEGAEFRLIASMINDGILPFAPKPVRNEHLRLPAWRDDRRIELRDYQLRAYKEFLEKGAVGIYWPPSAGKTFETIYAMAHLKGPHLIVVPTTTLVEQWRERINHYLTPEAAKEIDVITYASFQKVKDKRYVLFVPDECHALPANTFVRFSTLPCEYRMGLSATPYREDNRTDMVFALTGYPIGLDWNELVDLGIIEVPTIRVVITQDEPSKVRVLDELLKEKKSTIVFCDGIDDGRGLSRRYECAFVDGSKAKGRLETIRSELAAKRRVIVSRVGDEGVSLRDLDRVIEYQFLYGSRRQAGQRIGRLFHAEGKGEHVVLMTREEHDKYEKRLMAFREKGFRVRREIVA